ncbi:hypothetical protein ACSF59_02570 [Escherichia coli]|uniref:hypothetical protein n=1 Tax=Escherichia coli TaxID=562 RepID=UPI003EEA0855
MVKKPRLRTPAQFVGYRGDAAAPTCILLKNNGLQSELQIDANGRSWQRRSGAHQRCYRRSGHQYHSRLRRFGRGG